MSDFIANLLYRQPNSKSKYGRFSIIKYKIMFFEIYPWYMIFEGVTG